MKKDFVYSEAIAELDVIMAELRSPDIALDDALKLHEKGQALLAELEDFLQNAEVEIQKRTTKE